MSGETGSLALPDTVRSYLSDPAYRTGVEALLDLGPDKLPPEIGFAELAEYHAARGAAELTRYDYAETVHRAWRLIWGSQMPHGWVVASTRDLLADGQEITAQSCWTGRGVTLYHDRGSYSLFTAVSVEVGRTTIAFSVETDSRTLRTAVGPFAWRDDGVWEEWFVHSVECDPADLRFSLDPLVAAAALALAAAERFSRPRSAAPGGTGGA